MHTSEKSDPESRTQDAGPTTTGRPPAVESGATPTPGTRPGSIFRGLARRWRWILLLWLVVTSPLIYLIYLLAEPRFEAISLLRVEPTPVNIYDPGLPHPAGTREIRPYLSTQIRLISSDSVIDAALASPSIATLPMIRAVRDPMSLLRRELHIDIVGDNTYLITVMLASRDPNEAVAIVNGVVDAYLEQNATLHRTAHRRLKVALETELMKFRKIIEEIQARSRNDLNGEMVALRPGFLGAGKEDSESMRPSLNRLTMRQYRKVADRLLESDLELVDAQARLETARHLKNAASTEKLRGLEMAVEEARQRRNSYARYLSETKVGSGSQDGEVTHLKAELASRQRIKESLELKLAQLESEIGEEEYGISVQDKAAVPRSPASNNRPVYLAMTPVAVLLLILGLLLIQETRVARSSGRSRTS